MSNLIIYCLSLHNRNYKVIKELGYIPVGLGKDYFSPEWLTDKNGENISEKNPYYGEYSFHYWFWKNELSKMKDGDWVGFCAYREFWKNKLSSKDSDLNALALQQIPDEWGNFDVIIGEHRSFKSLKELKYSKILKYGLLSLIRNPYVFFEKNGKINIRLQFDMMHGNGNLDKAIDLLDKENREDFRHYTRCEYTFARGNMFLCKSKDIISKYYESLFPWLERCEKVFGFDVKGYGMTRIYAFLGERYLSYWFTKHTKHMLWPVIFYDTNKNYENDKKN